MPTTSNNVELLKEHLEEGYVVEEINFGTVNQEQITKVIMKLKEEKFEIVATNDSEFLEHISHFMPVRDQYGNRFLVYVDDAASYRQANQQGATGSLGEFRVQVGSRILENDIFMFTLVVPGPGRPLGRAHFVVPIEKNASFDGLDLKDEVKIFRKNDSALVFGGYVNELTYSGKQAVFICEGGQRTFKIQRISLELVNFIPERAIYFTTRVMGAKAVFPPEMLQKLDLREKDFVVVAPVRNLILKNQVSLGPVTFYSSHESEDDHIISKSDAGQSDSDWNGNFPRARVSVRATNHFDAMVMGYETVSRAIDWIAFRSDLSFTRFAAGEPPLYFSNFKYFSRARLTSKVYCRAKHAREACLYDTQLSLGTTLSIEQDAERFFSPSWSLFKEIISKPDLELTSTQRLIVRALYWLRVALHSTDSVAKLLDLWLSLEFASSGIKSNPKFSSTELEGIAKHAADFRPNGKELSEEQRKIITEKVNQANATPILERIKRFIEENAIPFSETEFELLKISRRKRNDIIHGRGRIQIEQQELDKMQSLIERVVLARARNELAKE